jgi:hypothetical protein
MNQYDGRTVSLCLLGEERFPEDMVLTVMLSASKDATTNRIMSLPWPAGRTPYHKFVADPLGVAPILTTEPL